jgi:hypothetical protein
MRYFIAIITTAALIFVPLIMLPLLQWYEVTFCNPGTDIGIIYVLLGLIVVFIFILAIIRWVVALKNDRDLL